MRFLDALPGRSEDLGAALGRALTDARQRAGLGVRLGKLHRARQQIAVHQFVDQAQPSRFAGLDRVAREHHFQRLLCAHHPRQALGAARTRQHAEFDFRQAQQGVFDRHPVGAGQRQFQAAAEGRAVNGGHRGLGKGVQPRDEGAQIGGLLARQIKGLDVGPGDEGAPATDDDHRLNALVLLGGV